MSLKAAKTTHNKPLVYACSGCSNVAQLTNDLAVVLDREAGQDHEHLSRTLT